jgi:hypothetical protein
MNHPINKQGHPFPDGHIRMDERLFEESLSTRSQLPA